MLTFNHVRDFYVLLSIQELAKGHPFRKPWEKLEEDTTELLTELSTNMSYAMRDYLALASFGEARHGLYRMGIPLFPDLHIFATGVYGGDSPHMTRDATMLEALYYDPIDALPKLEEIFKGGGWSTGVGGQRWSKIAAGALLWWTVFKDKPIAFVDYCVDLQHNNGTAFSKSEAGDLMKTASMHIWHLPLMGITKWLDWRKKAKPLDIVAFTEVVLPKTDRLAFRCCTLSNTTRTASVSTYDMMPDHSIDYVPLEWGDRKLELVERTTALHHDDEVTKRQRVVSPKVIAKAERVRFTMPDDVFDRDLESILKEYDAKVRRIIRVGMAEAKEMYPKHAAYLKAETDRIVRLRIETKKATIRSELMRKFPIPVDLFTKTLADFSKLEFENLAAYDKGLLVLNSKLHDVAREFCLTVPVAIREDVKSKLENTILHELRGEYATEWLQQTYGTGSRKDIDAVMSRVDYRYLEFVAEVKYGTTDKDPDFVKSERTRTLRRLKDAIYGYYPTTLTGVAVKALGAKIDSYIEGMEKPKRKEVMQGKAAFEKATLAELDPDGPPPPPVKAKRTSAKSKLLKSAATAKTEFYVYGESSSTTGGYSVTYPKIKLSNKE